MSKWDSDNLSAPHTKRWIGSGDGGETGWRDIESAPKDGSGVLVFCPGRDPEVRHARLDMPGSKYASWGDPIYSEWHCEPTHWQPLPEPPK